MKTNLKLIVNNKFDADNKKNFFEKKELKIILDLYAKMVSEGSWKDYGLAISAKQVGFSVFRNAADDEMYKICKNFKPNNKYYLVNKLFVKKSEYKLEKDSKIIIFFVRIILTAL